MVRDYELMYIVRPDLDDEALRAATESVGTLVRGLGGDVGKTAMWGKRRLAYEIGHLRDGHYVVSQLRLDGTRVSELERALRIHDSVFRHLLVRHETAAEAEEVEQLEASPEARPAEAPGFSGETDDVVGDGFGDDIAGDEIPAAETAEEDE
ncbi:MAG: 30S ribosomal protein S6 [Candidatus Dormiibacterota bacterium]